MVIRILFFIPSTEKDDEEKSDENCAAVKTDYLPTCIAVNDKLECNCLYSELLLIGNIRTNAVNSHLRKKDKDPG